MSPKKPLGKTKAVLEKHAKERAEERYGLYLNHEDRRNIVKMIQTGEADFVSRTSGSRTLWKVDYNDTSMNVVYDKVRHTMASVLPTSAVEFQPQVSCSVSPTQTSGPGCIECNQSTCQCPGNWEDWSK